MKNLNIKEFLFYMKNKKYTNAIANVSNYSSTPYFAETKLTNNISSKDSINDFYNSLINYKFIYINFFNKIINNASVQYVNEQNREYQKSIYYKTIINKYNCISALNFDNKNNIHIYKKDFHYREDNFYSFEEAETIINNFIFL